MQFQILKTQDEYAIKWEGIEEGLGRDEFRDLFAHIRMLHRKDKLRGTLEQEFQTYVLDALGTEDATQKSRYAVKFVDKELEPYADAYELVSRASYESTENADKVNALLRHLNRLDNFDWMPPALAFYYRYEGQTSELLKFTRDLERLALWHVYSACKRQPTHRTIRESH